MSKAEAGVATSAPNISRGTTARTDGSPRTCLEARRSQMPAIMSPPIALNKSAREPASRHADILRAAHAEPPRRAAREIEPRALPERDAPRPGVVDAHRDRAAVVRIGNGQGRDERPGASRGGVAG